MNLLGDAVKAIQREWYVFPINPCGTLCPESGEPIEKMGHLIYPEKRYKIRWSEVATRDLARILEYWTYDPESNIGIACKPSGLFVVDCDIPKREYALNGGPFAELHERFGPLVDGTDVFRFLSDTYGAAWEVTNNTYRVCTGSMGCHYYYRWPDGVQASQASIVKGLVDVRGNGGDKGGYVLGAGSATSKGPYVAENDLPVADAPEWLIDLCTEKPAISQPNDLPFNQPRGVGGISGLREQILTMGDGNRNNVLFWAARSACSEGVDMQEAIGVLGDAYTANQGPGGARQARSTIESAYRNQGRKT